MKANIETSTREEAANISAGLALPDIRAITVIAGLLDPMPYPAKKRILVYLLETYSESKVELMKSARPDEEPSSKV